MRVQFLFIISLAIYIQSAICSINKGTGSCPIKETIKICLPRCLSDFECVGNKRCCPNSCGTTSCSDVSPISTGNDRRNEETSVICGNVKCQPKQKCISDGSMKRPRCSS